MTRRRTTLAALAVVLVLLLMLLLLPMRFALGISGLDRYGFSAKAAHGSVWGGNIEELQFGSFSFGSVGAAMRFWPLFVGRTRIDIYRPKGPGFPALSAGIGTDGDGFRLDDATASVGVVGLLAPLPVERLELDDLTIHYADGACTEASGNIRAILVSDLGGLTLPPDGLLGTAECDGEAVHLPMLGASGQERIDLRLFADGHYEAQLRLTGDRADEADLLTAAGFSRVANAFILEMDGSF